MQLVAVTTLPAPTVIAEEVSARIDEEEVLDVIMPACDILPHFVFFKIGKIRKKN